MIISASYKTDIPAFYGEWFMNRLHEGQCRMVNPYSKRSITVDLRIESVDGIVFWTKNLGPFMNSLQHVREMGYSFVVQYSITGYPRELEASVIDAKRSIEHMHQLARDFGARVGVWRYDPVVCTSLTPIAFHKQRFAELAKGLEGSTDEVVISFAQMYRKAMTNMNRAARDFHFEWEDPGDSVKVELASELAFIARNHGMTLSVCSQRSYAPSGTSEARCIDARRLSDVSGRLIRSPLRGNREECACHESRDIGEYDTCPHGCVYCYAVRNRELARTRFREHCPQSASLYTANGHADNDSPVSQFPLFGR